MSDLPFKAEYAKSNRASCKLCSSNIGKDTLRLAIMVQSPHFDGKQPNWYHFSCFWKRGKCTKHEDVGGFDSLRWEDQEKIKEKITGGGGGGAGGAAAGGGDTLADYCVEYAKSNRSTCRGCDNKIEKDEVRISKKDYESERSKMYGPQDLWHHVDCFVLHRDDIGFTTDHNPDKIKGYLYLRKEDKDMLIDKLGKGVKPKKRKSDAVGGGDAKKAKKESKEEKALKEQSKLLWNIRDQLSQNVANNALKILLEYNSQDVPAGESRLLDRVSDCMAFGALQPCPECGDGQLVYSGDAYKCSGNLTEWTKCMHMTQTPKRQAFKVPTEYHDVDFLKKYKYEKKNRVFPANSMPSTSGIVSSNEAGKPLQGMSFVIAGKTSKPKAEITKTVQALGGTVATKIDKKLTAVISTKADVEKAGKQMKSAKSADVHVIDEGFLEAVRKGGAALLIQQHSICDWGSDPHERIKDVVDGPTKSAYTLAREKREEAAFTKSLPGKVKMTVKGGAAVDPDSNLEDQAHVYKEGKDEIYNAVLGMVDIARGTNSYYKLQILEADKGPSFWVFRAWGRVGTTIGGNKTDRFGSRAGALNHFKTLYEEKTANAWENRKNFEKFANRFYPLDIDYGEDNENAKKLDTTGATSELSAEVQDLIKMIFDVESMKKAMLEFEIDLKKMPLGKLSKKQIESAFKVLSELADLVDNGGTPTQFLDASNRFYTLIPHDFGLKKIPMLDSKKTIEQKSEMLNNLLDIEIAYSLLNSGDAGGKDPIDVHYEKLKTDIAPMDHKSEEFDMLKKYVKNTHASTHTQYGLEVEEVYKLERHGEKQRFKPFRALGNRKLLWHGSGKTNYAGILSQGLRIAPPEAPCTGYMFGKGVYFADMVSKSANYCRVNKSDPVGLLLLCDVALGNMYERTSAEFVTKLPKGMHSTKGCGMTAPDSSQAVKMGDVEVPLGVAGQSDSGRSSLLYNEYIVYDVAQINMKYLLRLKYNFKY